MSGCNLKKNSGLDFWCSTHSQLLHQTEKISGWTWKNLGWTWENIRFWILMLSSFSAIASNWKNLRLNLRKYQVLNFYFYFFDISELRRRWQVLSSSIAIQVFKQTSVFLGFDGISISQLEFFSGLDPNQILPKD